MTSWPHFGDVPRSGTRCWTAQFGTALQGLRARSVGTVPVIVESLHVTVHRQRVRHTGRVDERDGTGVLPKP